MCHECGDEEEEFDLFSLPPDEQNEFIEFAVDKFHTVIEAAVKHDVLYELITEWPKQKQAMFSFAVVMQERMINEDE